MIHLVAAGAMSDYPPNKFIPGTVYQVVRLLGAGGMGTVYEVEDTSVGKRYVLKTLHAELRDSKELAIRIQREARTLARLSHRNIVEVVTAGVTNDPLRLPFFVMQKLDGLNLRAVLGAKGRLPLATAFSIAIDLLDALDHAHGLGVIHRDVKPENIFLHREPNGDSVTKLLDFGIVRFLSSDLKQSGGRFVGTLRYAAPEQLNGGMITPRTDLYAAGLVLYEMIAGHGPFDGEGNDREIARAHLDKIAPPLSSRALGVPAAVDALVTSALAKDPDLRPRDAFSFAARLRDLGRDIVEQHVAERQALEPVETPLATSIPRALATTLAAPGPRRRAAVAAVVGAIAVVLLSVAMAATWMLRSARSSGAGAAAAARVPPLPSPAPTAPPSAAPSAAPPPLAAAPPAPAPKSAPPPRRAAPAPEPAPSTSVRRPGPGF